METGATPQQIQEAKTRHPLYEEFHGDRNYEEWLDMYFGEVAPLLVPVGYKIVPDDERDIVELTDIAGNITQVKG